MKRGQTGTVEAFAPPDLRGQIRELLDLLEAPLHDVSRAEALLDGLAPLLDATDASLVLRDRLLNAVEQLLARPDPGHDAERLERHALALSHARKLVELAEVDDPVAAVRRLEAGLVGRDEGDDPLVMDMREFIEAPPELLAGAHLLVRIAAAANRLARNGPQAVAAAAELTDVSEQALAARLPVVSESIATPADLPPLAELEARFRRFRQFANAAMALAQATDAAAAARHLEELAPRLLGAGVLVLWLDDDMLRVVGSSDLAGHALPLNASSSLAVAALSAADCIARDCSAETAAVVDRQFARRLGGDGLRAIPVLTPEPVAVLLAADTVAMDALRLLAVTSARWLGPVCRMDRKVAALVREGRGAHERRLREIVHEASNPLSAIQNYLHLLGARLEDEEAREHLGHIGDELRRTNAILRTLIDGPLEASGGSRPADGSVGPATEVNRVVREVLTLLEPSLGGIEVRTHLASDVQPLAVDGQRLRQVVLNLIKNAVEAMPEGGVLEVTVDSVIVSGNGRPGGHGGVELHVSDTGPGIAPDLLSAVFEPGVSTKGGGRGLGLAITQRLVAELGGDLSCRSRPGDGTTFVVRLSRA